MKEAVKEEETFYRMTIISNRRDWIFPDKISNAEKISFETNVTKAALDNYHKWRNNPNHDEYREWMKENFYNDKDRLEGIVRKYHVHWIARLFYRRVKNGMNVPEVTSITTDQVVHLGGGNSLVVGREKRKMRHYMRDVMTKMEILHDELLGLIARYNDDEDEEAGLQEFSIQMTRKFATMAATQYLLILLINYWVGYHPRFMIFEKVTRGECSCVGCGMAYCRLV